MLIGQTTTKSIKQNNARRRTRTARDREAAQLFSGSPVEAGTFESAHSSINKVKSKGTLRENMKAARSGNLNSIIVTVNIKEKWHQVSSYSA
jgi:hypothetical protein